MAGTTLTIRDLLTAPDSRSLEEAIAEASTDDATTAAKGVPRLGAGSGTFIAGRIGRSFSDSLDTDVTDLVATAWTRYDQVRTALERTRDEPGTSEVLPVVDHTTTARLEPAVDVTVRGVVVTTVTAQVVLSVTAQGIVATIEGGRVVQLRGGALVVDGRLLLEGVTLATKRTELSLPELYRKVDPSVVASPAPASTGRTGYPTGTIVNGHRWTGTVWEPVHGYRPGDIVNAHRLSADGRSWTPVPG